MCSLIPFSTCLAFPGDALATLLRGMALLTHVAEVVLSRKADADVPIVVGAQPLHQPWALLHMLPSQGLCPCCSLCLESSLQLQMPSAPCRNVSHSGAECPFLFTVMSRCPAMTSRRAPQMRWPHEHKAFGSLGALCVGSVPWPPSIKNPRSMPSVGQLPPMSWVMSALPGLSPREWVTDHISKGDFRGILEEPLGGPWPAPCFSGRRGALAVQP